MNPAVRSALLVWLLLMLSTVASTWGFSRPAVAPTVSAIAVVLIAALKVGLVMAWFMDLRHAPLPWRLAGAIWVTVTAAAILLIDLA